MEYKAVKALYVIMALSITYATIIRMIATPTLPSLRVTGSDLPQINLPEKKRKYHTQYLDGCKDVFIDVGANIGVHGRKVFDKEQYPCIMQSYFETYFGSNRSDVCVVGFEINPNHTKQLTGLSECYNRIHRKMFYFTEVAVSNEDNKRVNVSTLEEIYGGEKNTYWGTRIINDEKAANRSDIFQVDTINLARFVKTYVRDRKLPKGITKGNVVMKMDIEGSEFDVVSGMLAQGALCDSIDLITIEWHGTHVIKDYIDRLSDMPSSLFGCKMPVVVKVDDESFRRDGIPKPRECDDIDIPYAPKNHSLL